MGILDLANRYLERKNAELEVQLEELEREAALRDLERMAEEERIREENIRRRRIPCAFDDGITEQEFAEIVSKASKHIKRVIDVYTDGPSVYARVISQSGASEWDFRLDFNDYGHITGKYWIDSENQDSEIPFVLATYITKYIELLNEEKALWKRQENPGEISIDVDLNNVLSDAKYGYHHSNAYDYEEKLIEEYTETNKSDVPEKVVAKSINKHVFTWGLAFFLGLFGADRFYRGQNALGTLKLCTFGGMGYWVIVDLIIAYKKSYVDGFKEYNDLHFDDRGNYMR